MAKAPEDARIRNWEEWMRRNEDSTAGLAADCKALTDAADDFIDNFSDDFNVSIPQPARTLFNNRQKAYALVVALNERFRLGL